jgi:hypothetical protein
MTCSKIISGDLPEITYDILKYFQNDFTTLHSCILVNRLWCRLAIPLLWENPFSILTGNYNFINIYLENLNDELKAKLNEYEITINSSPSNTLFNYPNFIKYLSTQKFIFSIENWFKNAVKTSLNLESRYIINSPSDFDSKKLIHKLLLKIFIENEANLRTLEIVVSSFCNHDTYLDSILELILQNPNFFYNIRNLKIYMWINKYYKRVILCENRVLQLINSQKNLKKILFSYDTFPYYQTSLLSSNCPNSLNTIIFYDVNFARIDLSKIVQQLNVLESLHIVKCSINAELIQQIISLTKPFKLKTLYLKDITDIIINSLQLLFQKFGNHLENFGYRFLYNHELLPLKQQLLELIIKYCKNIKFFDLHDYDNKINYQILNLTENIKQNLNYLTINLIGNDNEFSSNILQNLGQILPSRLEYLNLRLHIKLNDLEIFLKNSQNIFIEKLLINNKMREDSEDILSYIKEYIMKKKRAKYLAIMNSFFGMVTTDVVNYKDLFSLKDEVKEFGLYNIKVQRYSSLVIHISSFVKEMD